MGSSDEALLKQYKQGDARAFRALVEQYSAPLYNLAFGLLRDPMEAENITQETFLRVVLSLDRVRLDMPLRPYLFRVALNLCHDVARRKHPLLFTDLSRSVGREGDDDSESLDETLADDAAPLWERLEEEELHSQLHAAIDDLPPIYRTVIVLRYVEDFSYEEIAQTLQIPLNTVRTQLRRARQQLKAKLEKDSHPVLPHNGVMRLRAAQGLRS